VARALKICYNKFAPLSGNFLIFKTNKIKMKTLKIIIISLLLCGLGAKTAFLAENNTEASFRSDYLISDFDFSNNASMSQQDIQNFLDKQFSPLRLYTDTNPNSGEKEWSWQIIKDAADRYKINPQILITLLQKEQSLIIGSPFNFSTRLNWAMGYAVCDNCSMSDPLIQKYKGFANQVLYAAKRLRQCLDEPNKFRISANNSFNIDGQSLTPANQATACLYNYTPHVHGNLNFWKIWNRWFASSYHNNVLIKTTDSNKIYWLKNEIRHLITSPSLLKQYSQYPILELEAWEINQYTLGSPIKHQLYSLLSDGKSGIYLISEDNTLRAIASPAVFKQLGFSIEEIEIVEKAEIQSYQKGKKIDETALYPLGALAKNVSSGELYYLKDQKKHLILEENIIKYYCPNCRAQTFNATDLNKYETGDKILYPDGTLLKETGSPIVYLIKEKIKYPIADEYTFKKLNFQWTDIISSSTIVLQQYPDGAIIDFSSLDYDISHLPTDESHDNYLFINE